MSATVTVSSLPSAAVGPTSLHLIASDAKKEDAVVVEEPYRYAHLLATFSQVKYPALQPFEHVDAGSRALKHPNPRSFLENSSAIEMTPEFGLDVRGCSLAGLTPDQKDQLALEVARRGVVVFRGQQDFIDRGPGFYTEWARHFGPLHVHPTSGHPEGHPEVHLVYKDAKSKFKTDSTTSTLWHSDCSFELQPAGLTTFFLLAQPEKGGDTLYSSQVLNFRSLSPIMQDFLRTLKATHTAVGSLRSKQGGMVRRDPIETIHPVVRRHPVTGEEALYVNKQFTRRIVGMKAEESDLLLNFLYAHIAQCGDHQARIKWEPMTMVLWDNRITAHTAVYDYAHMKVLRHGARISAQAERPIPALSSMKMED
ncbi:TauD-domain-containing protein [Mycena galopus ATCC 62051]|nr:TauD-domain-containing protein [Mycena galopus ATCC 62051]